MLKILKARLKQYVNCELPDAQAAFRKDIGTRDQTANILGSQKKDQSSRKSSTFALLTTPKPLMVWITQVLAKLNSYFIWLHQVLVVAHRISVGFLLSCGWQVLEYAGSVVAACGLSPSCLPLPCAHSMWDLSSLIRDQTCIPCIGRQVLNHWTSKKSQFLLLST